MIINKSKVIATKQGQLAEQIALDYLISNGLVTVTQNFKSPRGEIDIIMHEENYIVFIEVKYRTNDSFINPVETIDKHKCDRIIATSQYFQQKNHKFSKMMSRFDVVIITGNIKKPKIEWINNAFQA